MAQPVRIPVGTESPVTQPTVAQTPFTQTSQVGRQAYQILKFGFTAAPIIAGLDKFFNVLVVWDQYLASVFPDALGVSARTFMMGVGVIEIIAGIGVALKPRLFSYVVAAWLGGIIVNLLIIGEYYDIALRDFGLMLGALALGSLSRAFDRPNRVRDI